MKILGTTDIYFIEPRYKCTITPVQVELVEKSPVIIFVDDFEFGSTRSKGLVLKRKNTIEFKFK